MANVKKFNEKDLYKLIGVEITATEAEVSKENIRKFQLL